MENITFKCVLDSDDTLTVFAGEGRAVGTLGIEITNPSYNDSGSCVCLDSHDVAKLIEKLQEFLNK